MYDVLGFEKIDYVNKNGRRIRGTKIYLAFERENCEGFATTDEYLAESIDYVPRLGDKVNFFYDKYRKVVKVETII